MKTMKKTIIKMTQKMSIAVAFIAVAFSATDSLALSATYGSTQLKISGKLAECSYPQKSGGGSCLKSLNSQSCMDTTPFDMSSGKAAYGVSSEMCARGSEWCQKNSGAKRCPIPPKEVKNHEGYDYSAACGTAIYAPCDGKLTVSQPNGMKFTCTICGKTYEYTFYHNQAASKVGEYKRGATIGRSGNLSGYACHMHIEIRQNGVLLDPMNSSFDSEVCSCMPEKQVNRMNCFTGGSSAATAVDTQYDNAVTTASVAAASEATGASNVDELPDECIYSVVIANYEQAGCIFCTPFRILFNTASVMAKISYDSLANAVAVVVAVGFAIWLAYIIIQFISSFEIREPRILIKTILNQAFRVLVVILLLQAPLDEILSMTINPIFSTGLKIAQIGGGLVSGDSPTDCNLTPYSGASAPVGDGNDYAVVGSDVGGLSPDMGNGILCTIKRVQDQIMDIFAIATVSKCLAWEKATLFGYIPHLAYWITAIVFYVAGGLLLIIYPFLLVDSVLKLAIAIALFPAALGAYAFNATAGYLKKVWDVFINSMFTFIFLSIIILIIAAIAKQYMAEIITDDLRTSSLAGILWFTVAALKISFVLVLGWAVLGEAKTFADKFSKAMNFRRNIGSTTGSSAAALGKGAGKLAFKGAKKGVETVGGAVKNVASENASHQYRRLKNSMYQRLGSDMNLDDSGMTDEDGNTMYETNRSRAGQAWNTAVDKAKFDDGDNALKRGWNKTLDKLQSKSQSYRSFATDSNGNIMQTTTKFNKDGSVSVTKNDDFAEVTTTTGKDGKTQIDKIKTKASINHLVTPSGDVKTDAINSFMQNSMLSDEEKNMVIMKQLIDARMSEGACAGLNDECEERSFDCGIDENGDRYININQKNTDGSTTTFSAQFKGKRVMTTVTSLDKNKVGVSLATDGVIQRKTYIDGNKQTSRYAVSSQYDSVSRPIGDEGRLSHSMPKEKVLFSERDLKLYGHQVNTKGNKAYTFSEFK